MDDHNKNSENQVTTGGGASPTTAEGASPLLPPGWRLRCLSTLSNKFLAFFAVVLLVVAANGLVVNRILAQRGEVAAMVNVAGSLRYLSQKAQVEVQRSVLGTGGGPGVLGSELDLFERRLQALETGGTLDGVRVGRLPDEFQPQLQALRQGWQKYRDGIRGAFGKWQEKQDVAPEMNFLYQEGKAILAAADGLVGQFARQSQAAEDRAIVVLYGLALADVLIVLAGFLLVRGRVVEPLLKLAETSRRFAAGDYGARIGFRSGDELGELAVAFNHMAEATERHVQRIARDVDDLRRAEQSLHMLSEAVEHSPSSVIVTDRWGNIEYVNPKFVEITGYSREEVIGRKPRILKSGKTPPEVYEEMWATIQAGREWRGELQNRRKNGELFWEATRISPLKNEEGRITHFIVAKEDVTERKQAEDQVRRLNRELERRVRERTQQLEAINRELESFSYSVSHDLRAPLRAINGYAQLLKEQCGDCAHRPALEYLKRIGKASVRMGELIDDILRLSQIGRSELTPETVDLGEMARQVLEELSGRAPERRLEAEIAEGILVHGDPGLLRIVLENLLGNAWKFSAKRDVARIRLGMREENGERMIFVRDNGAGFDLRYAKKLFTAFQRLHRSDEFEGSGIGLAIVQRIVSLHGGRIWAEAEPGRGATFNLVLPAPADDGSIPASRY